MANNGSFNTGGYEGRCLNFSWNLAGQDVANNTSTINWTLRGAGGSSSYWYMAGNFKVIIDGVQRYFSANRIQLWNGTVVASGQVTLSHDGAGNRSFGAYAEAGIYTYAVNCSGSGSWSLPQIPRNSSGSFSSNRYTIGDTIRINFRRSSGAFTEDGWLQFPDRPGWVYDGEKYFAGAGDYWSWTPSAAEIDALYRRIPNSQSAVMWADCKTFYNGREIGTFSVGEATMSVNASICKPTFNASYKDTNSATVEITGNNQKIIRNQSRLQINVTNLSAKKYATIKTVKCTFNGTTQTGTISGSSCTFTLGTVNVSRNTTATITVTDSRGLSTSQNLTIQVLDWSLPTAIISSVRQNHYYTPTTLTVDANYASLDGKNEVDIKYRYEPVAEQYYTNFYNYAGSFYPHPNSPPSAINVKLNSDGSLTAYGSYQTATPPLVIAAEEDLTDTLEDGESYILSQTTANARFFIKVVGRNSQSGAYQSWSCQTENLVTFAVDKSTYDVWNVYIYIDLIDSGLGSYDYFSYTESFSLAKEGGGTWSSWNTIEDNVPEVVNLDNQYEWDLQVRVSDKLGTAVYNYTVPRGMPIIYFDRILSSVGINCFPQFEGSLEVNGTKVERSMITKSLAADATNLTTNTYRVLDLTNTTTAGTQLIPVAQGGIKIGKGVNKVQVSGRMSIEGSSSTDRRYIRIVLNNSTSSSGNLAWASQTVTVGTIETISITPILVDVKEGDVINLYYWTPKSSDTIKGGAGSLTALTVEVVE